MSLKGKKFRNVKSGEVIMVVDDNGGLSSLNNGDTIYNAKLLNESFYTELANPNYNNMTDNYSQINTNSNSPNFEQMQNGALNSILSAISNIDDQTLDKLSYDDDSAIIEYSDNYDVTELDKQEIARKYGMNINNNAAISANNQLDKFSDFIDPYDKPLNIAVNHRKDRDVHVSSMDERGIENNIIQTKAENPIIVMFKNAKKSFPMKVNLTIDTKLPRLDFIEMMEDTYDISIIDYLANEIANDFFRNKSNLVELVKDQIYNILPNLDKPLPETEIEQNIEVEELNVENISDSESRKERIELSKELLDLMDKSKSPLEESNDIDDDKLDLSEIKNNEK